MSQPIIPNCPIYPKTLKRARVEKESTEAPASKRVTLQSPKGVHHAMPSKGVLMRGGSFSSLALLGSDLFENSDDDVKSDDEDALDSGEEDNFRRVAPVDMLDLPASVAPPPPQKKLAEAAAAGDKDLLIRLLKNKVDPNEEDSQGRTALMAAAEAGQEEIVDFLLNPKEPLLTFRMDDDGPGDEPHHLVILNRVDNDGNTAFMLAAKNKHPRIMQKLMAISEEDAEHLIKTGNDKGETALMLAAASGNVAGVKMILKEDVKRVKKDEYMNYVPSYQIRDRAGKSAMRHARDNNQASSALLLQDYKKYIENIW